MFDYREFAKLDDKLKLLVNEAENDINKQFLIAKFLIQGQNNSPQNTQIGLRYLKNSMNMGCTESSIYYINLLLKGKIIPRSFEKAKKIIENQLKNKDEEMYNLMLCISYSQFNQLNQHWQYLQTNGQYKPSQCWQ